MANHLSLLFSLSLLTLFSLSSSSNPNPLSAAHTELTSYGFPIGLLPADVRGYTVNNTTGDFAIDFGESCKITLPPDNYVATYSKTVRGKIVRNKIAEIDGIWVWAFFKWWGITGIRMSGDDLVFEVGLVTAKYPVNKFQDSPACEGRSRKADS